MKIVLVVDKDGLPVRLIGTSPVPTELIILDASGSRLGDPKCKATLPGTGEVTIGAYLLDHAPEETDRLLQAAGLVQDNPAASAEEIELARQIHGSDEIAFDVQAITSRSKDGVWVQGWGHLSNADLGIEDEPQGYEPEPEGGDEP